MLRFASRVGIVVGVICLWRGATIDAGAHEIATAQRTQVWGAQTGGTWLYNMQCTATAAAPVCTESFGAPCTQATLGTSCSVCDAGGQTMQTSCTYLEAGECFQKDNPPDTDCGHRLDGDCIYEDGQYICDDVTDSEEDCNDGSLDNTCRLS